MHDDFKKKIITIMHDEFIFGENNARRVTVEEIEVECKGKQNINKRRIMLISAFRTLINNLF